METQAGVQTHEWILRSPDGSEIPLTLAAGQTITIGRDLTADVALLDAGVSRYHALLFLEGEVLWVEDLHSQNGTYLNSQRVQRAALQEGDILTFGRVHVTLFSRERKEASSASLTEPLSQADLGRLVEMSRKLMGVTDPGVAVQQGLDAVAFALGADRGAILLRDAGRERFQSVAVFPHEGFNTSDEPVSQALAQAILKCPRAQTFREGDDGPARSPWRLAVEETAQVRLHPVLAAPLSVRGDSAAVICLEREEGRASFERRDVDFLSAFAWFVGPLFDAWRRREAAPSEPARPSRPAVFVLPQGRCPPEAPRVRTDVESGLPHGAGTKGTELLALTRRLLGLLEERMEKTRCALEERRWETGAGERHYPSLNSIALRDFLRLSHYTAALRMVITAGEKPDLGDVDLCDVLGRALETWGLSAEQWRADVGTCPPLHAPVGALVLAVDLVADAVATWLGADGELTAVWNAAESKLQLSLQLSRTRSSGADHDVELPLALARSVLETCLQGQLETHLEAQEGMIVLEIGLHVEAQEETAIF